MKLSETQTYAIKKEFLLNNFIVHNIDSYTDDTFVDLIVKYGNKSAIVLPNEGTKGSLLPYRMSKDKLIRKYIYDYRFDKSFEDNKFYQVWVIKTGWLTSVDITQQLNTVSKVKHAPFFTGKQIKELGLILYKMGLYFVLRG